MLTTSTKIVSRLYVARTVGSSMTVITHLEMIRIVERASLLVGFGTIGIFAVKDWQRAVAINIGEQNNAIPSNLYRPARRQRGRFV